jgi:hypothetical protein
VTLTFDDLDFGWLLMTFIWMTLTLSGLDLEWLRLALDDLDLG